LSTARLSSPSRANRSSFPPAPWSFPARAPSASGPARTGACRWQHR
jgi:hypothetical protein